MNACARSAISAKTRSRLLTNELIESMLYLLRILPSGSRACPHSIERLTVTAIDREETVDQGPHGRATALRRASPLLPMKRGRVGARFRMRHTENDALDELDDTQARRGYFDRSAQAGGIRTEVSMSPCELKGVEDAADRQRYR
jgi:hypothetical protein